MAVIVKITKKTKPETIQKALRQLEAKSGQSKKKSIADFYGALPNSYGDGLAYQKKLRDEW